MKGLGPTVPGAGGELRGAHARTQGLEGRFKGLLHRRKGILGGLVHQGQQYLALKHALGHVIKGHPLFRQYRADGGQEGRVLGAPNGQHSTGRIHVQSSPFFPKVVSIPTHYHSTVILQHPPPADIQRYPTLYFADGYGR